MRGHRHVARHVVDVGVLADRVDLPAGRLEHRAALHPLLQPRAVARRELVDRCSSLADTITSVGASTALRDALREVARQPRAMPAAQTAPERGDRKRSTRASDRELRADDANSSEVMDSAHV